MIVNSILAICKMLAGILGQSSVLITDAINSIGDVATNIVVYISAIFSRREKDKDHPYGHEKYDSVISIFLGIAILYTAYEVGRAAIEKLYDFFVNGTAIPSPAWYTIIVAFVTIVVKELLFRKTKKDAKLAKSSALLAQAWDHRSDTIASFGAALGIAGVWLGFGFLDPIISIVIAVFILRLGIKIINSGINQVVDQAADDLTVEKIKEIADKYKEVKSIDEIKTRKFGMKMYADLEIGLDYSLTLEAAHNIAEQLHDEIEQKIPDILHCMIHVNPYYKDNK
jgi:cation diffusion facilitator family transporter